VTNYVLSFVFARPKQADNFMNIYLGIVQY